MGLFFVKVVMMTSKAITLLGFICATLIACTAESPQEEYKSGTYLVPLSFQPDAGRLDRALDVRVIDENEFAFMLSEDSLAKRVEGFQVGLHGVVHDTMVIVNVFDPEIYGDWKPTAQQEESWNNIWTMSDNWSLSCMWDGIDDLTGFYRYYTYCDPDPGINSSFFLMDRIPNPDIPRPENQNYIKGLCRIEGNFVRPEDGRYHQCQFRRTTSRRDEFTFRLRSENVRYISEVESYISSLLEEWRQG